jgi:hypothetical protein
VNKKFKFKLISVTAILLTLLLTKSFPYTYWQCENEPLVYRQGWTNLFLDDTLGNDSDSYNLRAQWAMSEWNAVANSNWNFFYRTENHAFVQGDGHNTVSGLVASVFTGGAIGTTWNQWDSCWKWGDQQIIESDVGFSAGVNWTFDPSLDGSVPYDFKLVAMHEFGHALGLSQQSATSGDNHENSVLTLMMSSYPAGAWFGDSQWRTVHADDRLGLSFLHPGTGTSREIAIVQWENAGGGNSQRVSGCSSSFLGFGSIPAGGTANVEFTMENLGTTREEFNAGFYLSSNNIISISDRLIGTGSGFMDPGFTGTFSISVTIPADVSPGNYWLGTYLDHDNRVPEQWEFNNAVSCPGSVRIRP